MSLLLKNKIYLFLKIICLSFLFICFIIFPKDVTKASKEGLLLWYNNLLPILFPFMIIIRLSEYAGIRELINKLFSKYMKSVFNVSGYGAFPFIMGLLSGNPMGAKITANLVEDKKITLSEAEKILSFSSNPGIAFVIGSIGTNMLNNKTVGIFLFFVMLLSSIITGIIFGLFKKETFSKYSYKKNITNISFGEAFGESVKSSADTITVIGGYIVFFCVLSSMLEKTYLLDIICLPITKIPFLHINTNILKATLLGIVEVTNGAYLLCMEDLSTSLPFISFIIGFGGLSIFFQSISMFKDNKIKTYFFFFSKILNGFISFVICYIFLNFFDKLL